MPSHMGVVFILIGKRVKGLDEKGFAFKTDMSPEMKEQIRQIVREEIAAHRGRPEVISPMKSLVAVLDEHPYYGVQVTD